MAVPIEAHAEPIPGYKLIERLGGGGFGDVWKCEAPGGLLKAMKLVYGDLGASSEDTHRAEQELKALSRVKTVRHPYILSLERYDIVDGQLIIVMELADRNLWDRFKECRSQGLPGIPRPELLGYLEETAEALDLMNSEHQLQHLDIKPQNLFLVHNHVKVADFGLVKAMEGMQASVTGGVTPVYAAPETFDGWVSRFSDQYSLAIVFQEMLTGQRPFTGNNVRHLVLQHMQAPPNLSSLPPADQPIIGRSLSKTPDERFPTCLDMVRALRAAGSTPTTEAPQTPSSGFHRPLSRSAGETRSSAGETAQEPVAPSHTSAVTASLRRGAGDLTPPSAPSTSIPLRDKEKEKPGTEPLKVTQEPFKAPDDIEGDGVLFPALVIGLGQHGLSVLGSLRRQQQMSLDQNADLPSLRLLLLDTDAEIVRTATRGATATRLPEANILITPLNRPSHYLKPRDGKPRLDTWINPRMLYRIPRSQVTTGVRALGRLAFCDHQRAILRRIQLELETILDPEALALAARQTGLGLRSNRPRVYIVTSLAGGTGSGMFLDLAYTIRAQLRQMGYGQPDVVGLLLVPPADLAKTRVLPLGNTCAALRELAHFARPETTFTARYQEREQPLRDSDPPFSRCLVLPLPEESDEKGHAVLAQTAGQMLWRELCSPLGRAADMARATLPPPPPGEAARFCQTFGLFQLRWPRQMIEEAVARQLCLRLVQRWMTKDSKPIRDSVQAWIHEQRTRLELDAPHFLSYLTDACQEKLGRSLDEAFAQAVRTAQQDRTDTSWAGAALEALSEMLGKITEDSVQEECGALPLFLKEQAEQLVSDWEQKLAVLPVQLIEEPDFRLAGAEEALRQLTDMMEKMLQHHEPLTQEMARRSLELHAQIQKVIATGTLPAQKPEGSFFRRSGSGTQGRPAVSPASELAELLCSFAKARCQYLVLSRLLSALVTLRGHLADELREINFCRVRLVELCHLFEQPGALIIGASAQGKLAAVEQTLYPTGCKNAREAIDRLAGTLETPERLHELDSAMEVTIRKQFNALVNICLSPANVLKNVEAAMLQTANAFVHEHLPAVDVAALFLEQYPASDQAADRLLDFYDDAAPRSFSGTAQKLRPSASGSSSGPISGTDQPHEVCVLGTPPGPAGEQIRSLIQEALPGGQWLSVPSADDIIFYREQVGIPLDSLPQLGPTAQDAYRQMSAAENFTPHTRTDVEW